MTEHDDLTPKQRLVAEAEGMGIVVDDEDTMAEIESKIAASRGSADLGAHVDPDDSEPVGFERVGNIKGVQPENYDEVPEVFR